jgi:hypothetical protein
MGLVDVVTMTVVLAGAVLLLYRSIRKGGSCHGCSGGCRSAQRDAADLVRLGRLGRPAPDDPASPPGADV